MLFAMNIQYDLAPLSNSALSLSIPLFHPPPPPLLIDSDAIRRLESLKTQINFRKKTFTNKSPLFHVEHEKSDFPAKILIAT